MWRKNWIWTIVSVIILSVCYILTVGTGNLGFSNRTRIVLFENYFNIYNWYFFFAYLPSIFVFVFLIKITLEKLENRSANKILVFATSFLVLYITYTALKINWINEINKLDDNTQELWNLVYLYILLIQFILISLLVTVSWKTEKRSLDK
ncbi:hypothetical protein [Flagellimonas sp.]|uniref:hypothetical protein n=1 Tax=Flagellimonas sp. TaxID=2058762 RepID=UPI003F4A1995